MAKSFPESTHTKHAPSGEEDAAHYVKGSHKVGAGHEDFAHRMDHPFGQEAPNSHSGEGKNPSNRSEGSDLCPEMP